MKTDYFATLDAASTVRTRDALHSSEAIANLVLMSAIRVLNFRYYSFGIGGGV